METERMNRHKPVNKYRCKRCGKTVQRESNKQWVESYCDIKDRVVHLVKVQESEEKDE